MITRKPNRSSSLKTKIDHPPNIFNSMIQTMKHMDKLFNKQDSYFVDFPAGDFTEKNNMFYYKLNVPKEAIKNTKIDIKNNNVTIKYTYKTETKSTEKNNSFYSSSSQTMSKTLPVPKNANPKSIKATYKNGKLTISLQKRYH